jgi:prevent-host-death family protein
MSYNPGRGLYKTRERRADVIRLTSSEARKDFADVVKGVRRGQRFLIQRHGKGIAAVVSVEDLEILEMIERRQDLRDAQVALERVEREGAIPWEEAKAQLGL